MRKKHRGSGFPTGECIIYSAIREGKLEENQEACRQRWHPSVSSWMLALPDQKVFAQKACCRNKALQEGNPALKKLFVIQKVRDFCTHP